MKKIIISTTTGAVLFLAVTLAYFQAPERTQAYQPQAVLVCEKVDAEQTICQCSKGKAGETVWCHKCNTGYKNGEKIKCPGQFSEEKGNLYKPNYLQKDKKGKFI